MGRAEAARVEVAREMAEAARVEVAEEKAAAMVGGTRGCPSCRRATQSWRRKRRG